MDRQTETETGSVTERERETARKQIVSQRQNDRQMPMEGNVCMKEEEEEGKGACPTVYA